MKNELHEFDVFPKVFPQGREITLTVRPINLKYAFTPGETYDVRVLPLNDRNYPPMDTRPSTETRMAIMADADGMIRITHTFVGEQQFFLRFMQDEKKWFQLSVYALESDLVGRYPYMGDLHMHTFRSDGKEHPAFVAASYRKMGYDFIAITDHRRYYPSLEAMDAYRDADIDMCLVPGEEVQMPDNDVHIINFGGTYSVNALVADGGKQVVGESDRRAMDGVCPPPKISCAEYHRQVEEIMQELRLPPDVEPFTYAACVWAYRRIREAGGLSIFAHPYWIANVFHVPYAMTDYMLTHMPCDAFEVLGGERYLDQNEFQAMHYYQATARGARIPVVGSSDSHGTVNNPNAMLGRTIALSPRNERVALIDTIRAGYSVAVDGISAEYRLVGDFRLCRYARFLMDHYFPLHDEMVQEEGRRMRQLDSGDAQEALTVLRALKGQSERMLRQYFAF